MTIKIRNDQLEYGDVSLHYCDPLYPLDMHHDTLAHREGPGDQFIRLLAYALFAKRIFITPRYLLSGGPFLESLKWAPELLQEGIIVLNLHDHVDSFLQLAQEKGLDHSAQKIAKFLDENCTAIKPFSSGEESNLFHKRLLEDLEPGGALRKLIPGGIRGQASSKVDIIRSRFEMADGTRENFIRAASILLPEHKRLFQRWAALRYYLTPMELEPVRIRDLPHSAALLAKKAGVMSVTTIEDPEEGGHIPEPMANAISMMKIDMPVVIRELDARCLTNAVLRTRDALPEAQDKFGNIIEQFKLFDMRGEINDALRSQLLRERLIQVVPEKFSNHFLKAVKSTSFGVIVGLMFGRLLSVFFNASKKIGQNIILDRKRKKIAPWRITYETLAEHIEQGRVDIDSKTI